jgi:hypothetical protein
MGKSQARHELQRYVPSVFFPGLPEQRQPQVVIEDLHQVIRPLGSSPDLTPGDVSCKLKRGFDIFIFTKRSAEYTLEHTEAETYIGIFDKARYVPIIKGEEQASRDGPKDVPTTSKRRAKEIKPKPDTTPVDGIPHDKRRPYLTPKDAPPRDLKLAISDRNGTQMEIIRNIVSSWISPASGARLRVPDGKRVIIDGHCLTVAGGKAIGIAGDAPDTDEDAYCTPILIGTDFGGEEDTVRWMPELFNRLGETDYTMFYMHKRMGDITGEPVRTDMLSTDTDTLMLGLVYMEKYGAQAGDLWWRYKPNLTWCFHTERPNVTFQEWVHVTAAYTAIKGGRFMRDPPPNAHRSESKKKAWQEERQRMTQAQRDDIAKKAEMNEKSYESLSHGVMTFVAAMWSCGCDYTESYNRLTHEYFIDAIRQHIAYIGDVVVTDSHGVMLNGNAYARLIKCAFMQSKDMKDKPESVSMALIHKKMERLSKNFQFPSTERIQITARHLLYNLILAYQVGSASELSQPNPLHYYYELVDPSKGLTRDNLIRCKPK